MSSLLSQSSSSGIIDAIGDTPLVELQSLSNLTKRRIFGKCEFLNPGGSVKDRPALKMVETAERQGLLKPGYTLVEGTGGNTGVGLALVCAAKIVSAGPYHLGSFDRYKMKLTKIEAGIQISKGTKFKLYSPSKIFNS